jgi:beta-phosphoglucomutase-like phosphatase (HAD superfamily)
MHAGSPEKIQRNLKLAGLLHLFAADCIVSATTLPHGKPAPDVYEEALRRVGCTDASRALVIEDAVHGLQAAQAAGCYAVGITNMLPAERLRPHADLIINHLTELDLASMTRGEKV